MSWQKWPNNFSASTQKATATKWHFARVFIVRIILINTWLMRWRDRALIDSHNDVWSHVSQRAREGKRKSTHKHSRDHIHFIAGDHRLRYISKAHYTRQLNFFRARGTSARAHIHAMAEAERQSRTHCIWMPTNSTAISKMETNNSNADGQQCLLPIGFRCDVSKTFFFLFSFQFQRSCLLHISLEQICTLCQSTLLKIMQKI